MDQLRAIFPDRTAAVLTAALARCRCDKGVSCAIEYLLSGESNTHSNVSVGTFSGRASSPIVISDSSDDDDADGDHGGAASAGKDPASRSKDVKPGFYRRKSTGGIPPKASVSTSVGGGSINRTPEGSSASKRIKVERAAGGKGGAAGGDSDDDVTILDEAPNQPNPTSGAAAGDGDDDDDDEIAVTGQAGSASARDMPHPRSM